MCTHHASCLPEAAVLCPADINRHAHTTSAEAAVVACRSARRPPGSPSVPRVQLCQQTVPAGLRPQQPRAPSGMRVIDVSLREAQAPAGSGPGRHQGYRCKVVRGPRPRQAKAPAGSRLPADLFCCQQQAGLHIDVKWLVQGLRKAVNWSHCCLKHSAVRLQLVGTHQVNEDGVAKAQPGSLKEFIQQLLNTQHDRLSAVVFPHNQSAVCSECICRC